MILVLTITCCCKLYSQSSLLRGPYLQLGTSTSIIVKWKTSVPTDSQVKIGFIPGNYFRTTEISYLTSDHEVLIDNLIPDTKYYYTIGSVGQLLQGDIDNYFTTYPPPGVERKFRFWITGDCGNGSSNQQQVRDQYINYAKNQSTDGWLLLGDNAYSSGLESEYDANFFAQYQGNIMKHTVLWPAPGNHDYSNNASLQKSKAIPYYDLFTLPTLAEAGGISSYTESYYSYNIGNIHFISLDSYGEESLADRLYDTLSPQVNWLKKDLSSNYQTWSIVYWHHPPYTKGSHDSDTEDELVKIRENLLRILDRYDVDLVLCGHSHSYERSKLLKGHYDFSSLFDETKFIENSSSALYDGTTNSCPYIKKSFQKGGGIVYIVAGSAGQIGGTTAGFPHPAMFYSNRSIGGSLILEAEKNRLDLKWLAADGVVRDSFTMMKDVGLKKSMNLFYGNSIELTASWPGTHLWNRKNEMSQSIKVSPVIDTVYVVQDNFKCLTDTYEIKVDRVTGLSNPLIDAISVFPNPSKGAIRIRLPHPGFFKVELTDISGQVISTKQVNSEGLEIDFELQELQLKHGIYLINVRDGMRSWLKKVVVE